MDAGNVWAIPDSSD